MLELERLFSAPPLGGVLPVALALSPDGSIATYLRAADDDRQRQDLWCFDLRDGGQRCLIDSSTLPRRATPASLSDEEKARRERRRVFAQGIVEYTWLRDGSGLVFPLDGIVYLYRLDDARCIALTPPDTQQVDVRLSPDGRRAVYVRDGDVYCYELPTDPAVATGREVRLTHTATATRSHGLAEFIAQEEMHRFEGYWFSSDGRRLAFTTAETGQIAETTRYEIDAAGITMIGQRYPFAGAVNATVTLHVLDFATADAVRTIPWQSEGFEYLARVEWTRDNSALLVQRQSRTQDVLELVRIAVEDGAVQLLARERAAHWVNLHDNLLELGDGRVLWTSEATGTARLECLAPRSTPGDDGVLRQPFGPPDLVVTRLLAVRSATNDVLVLGWRDDPTQQHLFGVALDGDTARQLTNSGAWHTAVVAANGDRVLDSWSRPDALTHVDALDLVTGASRRIVDGSLSATHPLWPYRAQLPSTQFGTLTAADGQTLWYRLVLPADFDPTRCYPVLQQVYGGPGVSRVRREWLPWWNLFLATRGVVTFELDNRGSALRGRAFEAPIHRTLGMVEVEDQLCGTAWLEAQPFVDPRRIAVAGHSYGGYLTLMLLAKAPGRFACGVSTAPVTEWALYDTHYTERYLGLPQDNAEGYRNSAVWPWLNGLQDPLLVMHGMADDNVLFTHCTRLMKVLQDQGRPFELMTYPGSKHGLAEPGVPLHRYRTTCGFLARHLNLPELQSAASPQTAG